MQSLQGIGENLVDISNRLQNLNGNGGMILDQM